MVETKVRATMWQSSDHSDRVETGNGKRQGRDSENIVAPSRVAQTALLVTLGDHMRRACKQGCVCVCEGSQ